MRSGDWFATYTGVQFYLTDPHPDDVRIEDIGHALSMVCRFGGHTSEFYSVAQHSVHCSQLAGEDRPDDYAFQLHVLLHDASEGYLGDIVRPLKYSMPDYREYERRMAQVIYEGLRLSPPTPRQEDDIKSYDDIMLMTERRDLIEHRNYKWSINAEPTDRKITPWSPTASEYQFITRYEMLRGLVDKASSEVTST